MRAAFVVFAASRPYDDKGLPNKKIELPTQHAELFSSITQLSFNQTG
jgi:hypothetical protein